MSKVVLDVSMSLNGFIAGPNGREAEPRRIPPRKSVRRGGHEAHRFAFSEGRHARAIAPDAYGRAPRGRHRRLTRAT